MTAQDDPELPPDFDGATYLLLQADVAAALEAGHLESPEQHWLLFGHREGRLYSLPEVSAELLGGGVFRPETFRYPYSSYGRLPAHKFEGPAGGVDQIEICERLISAWNQARRDPRAQDAADGMWSKSTKGHVAFYGALEAGDAASLSASLADMFQTRLTHGLAMGGSAAAMARHAPEQFAASWCDRLLRLAEAVGVSPVRSAEQSTFNAPLVSLIDELDRIESALGFPLHLPAVGGTWGVELHGAAFPEISLSHAYVAFRAGALLSGVQSDIQVADVAEIGGGFGGLAYFLRNKARRYSVYDLPFSNVIQGYFLLMAGVPCALHGEDREGVRILPWWTFYEDQRFDLVINQDSIPEMPPEAGRAYIRRIKDVSRFFYSINQEASAPNTSEFRQLLVPELVSEEGGYSRLTRNLFWLRDGYVEEFYRCE